MKPHHFLMVAFLGMLGRAWADDAAKTPLPSKLPLVVITQIVEHDALTKEREGIIEGLKDAGFEDGKTVTIQYQNAHGNIAMASQIAAGFASLRPSVAVGISTPSAQSLVQPMAKQGVPVVFAAVTDPIEARLVSTLDKRPENVTGVSDGLPLRPQFELIQKLIPTAKTIGVLYNPGEANSAKAVEVLKALVGEMGFSLVFATTDKTADTITAALSLVGKAQVIFIPNDNTVMASISGIVALGKENNLPILTPDYDSVEKGVLAVRAASHKTMGYKAGQLVAKILKGEKASELPVEVKHPLDLAINATSAEAMGISIPEGMKKDAKLVR
jgi:putative ABC transport system substrate-binding protein